MSRSLSELSALVARVSDIYAARTAITRDDDWYLLKLQEELGELVAEHLRASARKRSDGAAEAEIRRALEDETADLLATTILYAHHNGIDLDAELARKWFSHLPAPQEG
jgi:NTP pyrophosphatase (non-canonical NTP hydrolase)